MTERLPLREPDYIDLGLSWKLQPRDLFGRWASEGAPSKPGKPVFDKQLQGLEAERKKPLAKLFDETKDRPKARELTREEVRKTLALDPSTRGRIFEAAGLKPTYKESETELIQKWHATKDDAERKAIHEEILVRQKALSVAVSTIKEAELVARRSHQREFFRVFDDRLKGSKMGKALLSARDKMTSDAVFDVADKIKQQAKDYGKDWAAHLAESRVVQTTIGASVALSVHLLGGEGTPEVIRSFMENPMVEAGLGAAASLALVLAVKALRTKAAPKAKVAAKKVDEKVKVKPSVKSETTKKAKAAKKAAAKEVKAGVHVPVKENARKFRLT